jgi:site-specific DNA-cytosine methylase
MQPKVLWGENAPGFAGKIGDTIRNQMYDVATQNGYTMSVYRTRSLLHGIAQVRERSFYFFWKGDKTPLLNYYDRPRPTIEDTILSVKSNTLMEPINPKTPSKDDPYYRFILEYMHKGLTHAEFCRIVEPSRARGNDVLTYIEKHGVDYDTVSEWMSKNGYEREVPKCARRKEKLAAGKNIMRRGTVVPRDYIGAFVGHYPTSLTHPVEDRYITYREGLSIMGMPEDFELLDPKKSANHMCQNVPVGTATDMATEVKEALLGNRQWTNSKQVFQYNYTKTHEFRDMSKKDTNTNLSQFV